MTDDEEFKKHYLNKWSEETRMKEIHVIKNAIAYSLFGRDDEETIIIPNRWNKRCYKAAEIVWEQLQEHRENQVAS